MTTTHLTSGNTLIACFQDNIEDLILIFPGGAYAHTSSREGEPVMARLYQQGFHVALYHYRKTMLEGMALFDEGKAVIKTLKAHPMVRRLHVMGFSAGGHFAGMMTSICPEVIDRTVLCYPVVTTTKPHRHEASFKNLMGRSLSPEEETMFSLEKRVPDTAGPLFLMHTKDDETVNFENSRLLETAYRKKGLDIVTSYYEHGPHGVSLATKEVAFESMDPFHFERLYAPLQVWFSKALAFLTS